VKETPPRDRLWEIQTPQAFQTEIIREAFRTASRKDTDVTDDATLVERLGRSVAVLEGMRTNIKITVPEDLLFAEALLRKGLAP
ncbi:MAG: 2-C-methyl-D-erythritol 4-phosphate cytidylyltransferase, partial [Deltaproteobacteria bacterium]|nr:2-C-methyl-D-erythritol 4-phosphate cytidylyltransferase [Deltaproteobacteria bacterium]